jgi:O-antigen ligase
MNKNILKKPNRLHTLCYVYTIIALTYSFVSNILYYYGMAWSIFNIYNVSPVLFSVNCVAAFIVTINITKNSKIPFILALATLFWAFTILSTVLNVNQYGYGVAVSKVLSNQSMWLAVFIVAFYCSKKNVKNIDRLVLFTLPIFVFMFLQYKLSGTFNVVNAPGATNSIYYIIMFLPFVLDVKKNILKAVLVLLITFCVLISLKRTAFLALVFSLSGYFIVEYSSRMKKKKKRLYLLLGSLLVALLMMYLYSYTKEELNLDIIVRLNNLKSDWGSGRNIIYEDVWAAIKSTPFMERFFGYGYNGVFLTNAASLSAHNDFLEVLYDYGLFGFALYISFIVKLIKYNVKIYKGAFESAAGFTASLVMFFTFSMFSHLIYYPTYFAYLLIYWGLKIAKYEEYCTQQK